MRTTIDTAEYGRTYGRGPRGLGFWAFRATYSDGLGKTTESAIWFFRGSNYSTAKREAKARAKAEASTIGCVREVTIAVLP